MCSLYDNILVSLPVTSLCRSASAGSFQPPGLPDSFPRATGAPTSIIMSLWPGSKLLELSRKEREGNRLPWISIAQTKEQPWKQQPQQTGGLTAYLHGDTIVPDRFISSWVPAMRCKTWSFVSRGKAAAKRMLDTLSESPWGGISGRHPSRPILFSCSPLLASTSNLPLLSTLFRDLLLPRC